MLDEYISNIGENDNLVAKLKTENDRLHVIVKEKDELLRVLKE
jgi:hypothetical protein